MSPYSGIDHTRWMEVTEQLLDEHPLSQSELLSVVQDCWSSIFCSRFGTAGFKIGQDIFPKPQIMGFLLHELVPLELAARFKGKWRVDSAKEDKDCVFVDNEKYSFEIKTSSNPKQIFGNRSYAQANNGARKSKDGYYLTVNFEKFSGNQLPKLKIVRFGWIDSSDWRGQKSATGQQSNLPPEVYAGKLKTIFSS